MEVKQTVHLLLIFLVLHSVEPFAVFIFPTISPPALSKISDHPPNLTPYTNGLRGPLFVRSHWKTVSIFSLPKEEPKPAKVEQALPGAQNLA